MATRILIRAPKDPRRPLTLEASYAYGPNGVYGSNAGNLLFAESVFRSLSIDDVQVIADGFTTERPGVTQTHIERINSEFDAFVLPLANAFRDSFLPSLRRLTKVVNQLTIPVVVTGVGAQLPPSGDLSSISADLKRDVRDFMDAVLNRSASVGVRGDMTAKLLSHLGYKHEQVDVIGCPSLYDYRGVAPRVEKRVPMLDKFDPIALNITPSAPWAKELASETLSKFRNSVYVPQEHNDLALLLWGQPISALPDTLPKTSDSPWIQQARTRFFVDARTWREFMSTRVFSFGHRIHGNIAALSAGTPACVLSFDSRTTELADYHGIPQIPANTLNRATINAAHLYDSIDMAAFNRLRAENTERWAKFLDKNGLEHSVRSAPGINGFDGELEAAGLCPPAGRADLRLDELKSRVNWMWAEGQTKNKGRYTPDFAPYEAETTASKVKKLQDRQNKLIKTVQELTKANQELRELINGRQRGENGVKKNG